MEEVLVLRLARAVNRSQDLIQDAADIGLPLEFFAATDGRQNENFRSHVLPSLSLNGTCSDLIGAIFDSHERAWQRAALAQRPTLILEDDVRIDIDFPDLFAERAAELPAQDNYHMAFVGASVTPGDRKVSPSLSQPDPEDMNLQALLGFWGYVVTPKGAKRLLKLAGHMRAGDRRSFQPVDLFVGHRLKQLKVFIFEPPEHLVRYFDANPDRHHVLETMRQIGIVKLAKNTPSLNKPTEDDEYQKMMKLDEDVKRHGGAEEYDLAWRAAKKALKKMRRYSCWSAAPLLSNAGLTLLRHVLYSEDGARGLGANATLMLAIEAFSSAIRYNEGTWLERGKRGDFPGWVDSTLQQRIRKGFRAALPPDGWHVRVPLPDGGWLEPKAFRISEPVVGAGIG